MDNTNQMQGIKRKRGQNDQERKKYPSDSKEARRERNIKSKEAQNQLRGNLVYYYQTEDEKTSLFQKMDKIKLFLGEGKFNKVSTFSLLHRLCDFFINVNIPGEDSILHGDNDESDVSSYQHCSVDQASSEELFVGCMSSVHKLVSQVQTHSIHCPETIKITGTKKMQQVLSVEMQCTNSDHSLTWTSSPHLENGKFVGNMKICHGYFTSGMLPNHFTKFLEASGLGVTGNQYLSDLSSSYAKVLEAAVTQSYSEALTDEIAMTSALKDDNITGISIITDARHCWRKNAKFSDIVCIGNATHKLLKIATVTKDDDPSSQRHELIGVKKVYEHLDGKMCPVDVHAHDNNNQITKYVREERSPTENAIDTWHMTNKILKCSGVTGNIMKKSSFTADFFKHIGEKIEGLP